MNGMWAIAARGMYEAYRVPANMIPYWEMHVNVAALQTSGREATVQLCLTPLGLTFSRTVSAIGLSKWIYTSIRCTATPAN